MSETIWVGAAESDGRRKLNRVRELYDDVFLTLGELVERLLDEKLAENEEETPDNGSEAQEVDE